MNNEQQHTPEPWYINDLWPFLIWSKQGQIATTKETVDYTEEEAANARRIVACVNACQGIEDPEKFIEGAKKDKIWHQRAAAFLAEKGLQDQFYQWVDKQQQ